ncbi:MAG: SprT-like domain-containing protein, partial [Candidatus Zixiibacteriota bacterium]
AVNYNLFSRSDLSLILNCRDRGETLSSLPSKPELPTESELYLLFDQLNHKYFGGSLPRINIKYSGRMLIAGSYTPQKRIIKIGKKYHSIFPEEIEDTLKHEMIHILYPSHDAKFKAVAAGIGASLRANYHPDLRAPFKYLYICPSCNKEYPRRKRLRMASCGVCSKGSRFDPKYKLVLKKST